MHRKARGCAKEDVCKMNKKGEEKMLVLGNGKVITRDAS